MASKLHTLYSSGIFKPVELLLLCLWPGCCRDLEHVGLDSASFLVQQPHCSLHPHTCILESDAGFPAAQLAFLVSGSPEGALLLNQLVTLSVFD